MSLEVWKWDSDTVSIKYISLKFKVVVSFNVAIYFEIVFADTVTEYVILFSSF